MQGSKGFAMEKQNHTPRKQQHQHHQQHHHQQQSEPANGQQANSQSECLPLGWKEVCGDHCGALCMEKNSV